ncbi:hypothetical protein PFUM301598_46890 [Pseudomonas fluorescens]|jgi:hypothetical protein
MAEAALELIAQGFLGLKWMRLGVEPLDGDMPGGGFSYACYQIQQRSFACAMLPKQAYAFLAFGAKREVGDNFSFAQVLCQAAYLEHLFTE